MGSFGTFGKGCGLGHLPVLRGFYREYLCSEKYTKYREYPPGGKGGVEEASLARGAGGQALTCPSWCIRTPPCCPPPHAGDAKLRPACPANAVIILLESTCPSYGQVRKSIMTYLPSENETYLVSPACGTAPLRAAAGDVPLRRGLWPRQLPRTRESL